ncbi:MAG: radical SAM/SPASM domain-containing protein [Candidatus Omnitrophica bacterium]|nr:radical SAM/SPASM domain-containing protein [Candidatus Omnitrophota bacterium]
MIRNNFKIRRLADKINCIARFVAKILRYGRIFIDWKILRTQMLNYLPEDVSIEVTNNCNFKCHFCPQSKQDHFSIRKRAYLSPEQAKVLIAKLRKGGIRTSVMHWTLDGEPFLNPKFSEICKIAQEYNFTNQIFSTNGFFLTLKTVRSLPQSRGGRYTFCVDFCSDKKLFESWRGTRGAWEMIINNINQIMKAEDLGHIKIKMTDISNYEIQDPRELSERLYRLKSMFRSDKVVVSGFRTFHNMTGSVSAMSTERPKHYHLCPYPWLSLVIASNGEVVACCRDLEHKTIMGNLFEQELQEIWNGEKYQQLRMDLAERKPYKINACKDCDMPYSHSKFTVHNVIKTMRSRWQIFS